MCEGSEFQVETENACEVKLVVILESLSGQKISVGRM